MHHFNLLAKSAANQVNIDSPPSPPHSQKIQQIKSTDNFFFFFKSNRCNLLASCAFIYILYTYRQIDGENYVSVVKILRERISRKRHELVGNGTLHHDNVRPYAAISVYHYLSKYNIKILPHTPNSSHLAPCDFWLCFRRWRRSSVGDSEVTSVVKIIWSNIQKGFTHFEKLVKRWSRCSSFEVWYFKKKRTIYFLLQIYLIFFFILLYRTPFCIIAVRVAFMLFLGVLSFQYMLWDNWQLSEFT